MSWKLGSGAALLALVVACSTTPPSSSPTPAAGPPPTLESVAGVYTLVSVDGRSVAANAASAKPNDWAVVAGKLTLRPEGTFRIETTLNSATDGAKQSALDFTGTCYKADEVFQMVWEGGGETNFLVSGDTVVVDYSGKRFAYVRK